MMKALASLDLMCHERKKNKKLQVSPLSGAYFLSNDENERTSGDMNDNTWTHIQPYWDSCCFDFMFVCVYARAHTVVCCKVYFFGFRRISLPCLRHLNTVTTAAATVVMPRTYWGSWKDKKSWHIYFSQCWLRFYYSRLKVIFLKN